jgi:RNA polymerase sigma-B factor
MMLGEIRHHLRDKQFMVRVPDSVRHLIVDIDHAIDRLRRELRRSPTSEEVARECATSVDEVAAARRAAAARDVIYLQSAQTTNADNEQWTYAETLSVEEERYALIEDLLTLDRAIHAMSDTQRAILRLRFAEDLTQYEIADRLGISQMHVSRLLNRALGRLQAVVNAAS